MTNTQVNKSFQSYLSTSILTNMKARNTKKFFGVPYPTKDVNVDKVPEYTKWLYDDKLNGEYYCYVAVTYSGDAMSTTYGEMAYPHTYYAVFLMEKEVFDGSFRRWYAFVFCNDSVGDTFSEADYNDVMNQIKKTFNITVFPTQQYNEEAKNYNKESDMRKGASYEQLNAMFNMTKQFYTMYNNQSVNIDELTDEEVQKDDSITEVTFD